MQNMLRPIVEAAGYLVIGEKDELDRRRHHRVAGQRDRAGRGRPRPAPRDRSGCRQRQGQHLSLRPRRPADGPQICKRGEALMNELLLIVSIAGSRVALPAAAVESVVELESLIPVPRAPDHLAGLSALRSRVLTVIDCQRSLELGSTDLNDGESARGRGGRDRWPSLCADRRCGRGCGRGPVRTVADPRRDGRRLGAGVARAWSKPRKARCCWSTSPPWSPGPAPKPARLKRFVTLIA